MMKNYSASNMIEIVAYNPGYRSAFRDLNKEWIDRYFKMEDADYNSLNHPEEYILNKGGFILIALIKKEPVGVCAMIKMKSKQHDYELAKMAVSPQHHGKGIGYQLGKAVLDQAQELGAKKIYLESNTVLEPAINLYRKLGFVEIKGYNSPYERSNIQMEYWFDKV